MVKNRFEALDGLRGVAAGAVLLGHATAMISGAAFPEHKGLAVQFFFMLSGFVVAYAYERRLLSGMTLGQFALRRAIRLYPMIVAGALLGAALLCRIDGIRFHDDLRAGAALLLAFLCLPSPPQSFGAGAFPINPPQWSLFFELVAYFVYAAVLVHLRTFWLFAIGVLGAAGHYVVVEAFTFDMPLLANVFSVFSAYSIGVALWRLHDRRQLPALRLPFLALAALVLGLSAIPQEFGVWVDVLSLLVLLPLVISCGSQPCSQSSSVVRILGELSYPVYILHWPILAAAKYKLLPLLGPGLTVLAACTATVAVSWLALQLFDKPTRAWLDRMLSSRAPRAYTAS